MATSSKRKYKLYQHPRYRQIQVQIYTDQDHQFVAEYAGETHRFATYAPLENKLREAISSSMDCEWIAVIEVFCQQPTNFASEPAATTVGLRSDRYYIGKRSDGVMLKIKWNYGDEEQSSKLHHAQGVSSYERSVTLWPFEKPYIRYQYKSVNGQSIADMTKPPTGAVMKYDEALWEDFQRIEARVGQLRDFLYSKLVTPAGVLELTSQMPLMMNSSSAPAFPALTVVPEIDKTD